MVILNGQLDKTGISDRLTVKIESFVSDVEKRSVLYFLAPLGVYSPHPTVPVPPLAVMLLPLCIHMSSHDHHSPTLKPPNTFTQIQSLSAPVNISMVPPTRCKYSHV